MLHGGDYEDYIGKDKPIVVNFFSRFSAESKRTAGEWEKVVEKYMNEGNNILVAMIDGWNYESIPEIYGIEILPAILFFAQESTTPVKFEGEITADNLIGFIEKMVSSGHVVDASVMTKDSEDEIMVQVDASTIEAANNDVVIVSDDQELEIMVEIDASNLADADVVEQMLAKIEDEINLDINEHIDMVPPEEKALEPDTVKVTEENAIAEPATTEMASEIVVGIIEDQIETQQTQEELRKEVKVVLNTTLLQSQFQEVQDRANDIRTNIKAAISDNSQKIEELKEIIDTQKIDMKDLYEEIQDIVQVVEEITEKLFLEKEEGDKPSMMPASRHLEEVKNVINEVKNKMLEDLMGGGENSTPRSMLFLIGAVGGAAIAYIVVSLRNNKKKRLYD